MDQFAYLHHPNLYTVACRPALPKDTPDVLEISRHIWEGHDYIPEVWDEWRMDPEGVMAVAEYGGRVAGFGKLSKIDPGMWWMEGLRVHPGWQGKGIASRLHEYLLYLWERYGDGTIGLATASMREPVHHLCRRTGFDKIGEFTPFIAPAMSGSDAYQSLQPEEASRALQFSLESDSLELSFGLMDFGWQWGQPVIKYIREVIDRGRAWWWRGGDGLLLVREREGDDDREPAPLIQLLACSRQDISTCLRDYRGLAGALGYKEARWTAPLHPELQPYLEEAGFKRDWENSIYVFQKSRE